MRNSLGLFLCTSLISNRAPRRKHVAVYRSVTCANCCSHSRILVLVAALTAACAQSVTSPSAASSRRAGVHHRAARRHVDARVDRTRRRGETESPVRCDIHAELQRRPLVDARRLQFVRRILLGQRHDADRGTEPRLHARRVPDDGVRKRLHRDPQRRQQRRRHRIDADAVVVERPAAVRSQLIALLSAGDRDAADAARFQTVAAIGEISLVDLVAAKIFHG